MPNCLAQILAYFINAGIHADLRPGLAKKIKVSNTIAFITFFLMLPYIPLYIAIDVPWLSFLLLPFAFGFLGTIELNRRSHYRASRLGILIICNLSVTVYAYSLGYISNIHLFFIPTACQPFILFELRDLRFQIASSLLSVFLCMIFIFTFQAPLIDLSLSTQLLISYTVLPATFLTMISSVYYLILENERAERGLATVLADWRNETERSHQIFDAIPDMITLKDRRMQVLWGNKAYRTFYGIPHEPHKRFYDGVSASVGPCSAKSGDDAKVLETGAVLTMSEEKLVRFDGDVRWFNSSKAPIRDLTGKPHMIVTVCRDMTQQREADRIIAEQRSVLFASAKLSSLGEMAAGIAHEINNPLAVIAGRASNLLMLIDRQPVDLDSLRKFAHNIESMTSRITAIIRGLRQFARNGEKDPFISSSLQGVVHDTLDLCVERFRSHAINLEVDGFLDTYTLECRAVQISQVLLNLLNNAFDAIRDTNERWIRLTVTRERNGYLIGIADSGPGVEEEIRDKIFEPFFTTKPIGEGTGLGLSVSKGIVKDHFGILHLDPSHKPTRFLLWLPERHQPSSMHEKTLSPLRIWHGESPLLVSQQLQKDATSSHSI